MEYTVLAYSDLSISRIGLGCEQLGGMDWGRVKEEHARDAVERAVALGINFFDTANVYGLGLSEERLSVALGSRRHEVVIASKCGLSWAERANGGRATTFIDARPQTIVRSIDESLRRLRVDRISICFLHWPDEATPIEHSIEAMLRILQAGKIGAIGLSNFSVTQIRRAAASAPISAVELPYNLAVQSKESAIAECRFGLGISVIAYGGLAQGLLSGRYNGESVFDSTDRRSRLDHFRGEAFERNLASVDGLRKQATLYGKTVSQVALSWVLQHPAITSVLVGAKVARHVEENVGALGWAMPVGDRKVLSDLFTASDGAVLAHSDSITK